MTTETQPREEDYLVEAVTPVVMAAWVSPFTTKSDYAREHASEVAAAACLGYITTAVYFTADYLEPRPGATEFGERWRLTLRGAKLLAGE
jgi:hypothetical protein